MKTILNTPSSKAFAGIAASLLLLISSVKSFAQSVPEKVDVDINAGGDTQWYGQPWVWAVGVAVFVIIIVALTRNNRNA